MSAAAELGRYGITANMVRPPVTDTGWVTPEVERQARELSPLGVARPEEVAEVIVFLASNQARRITGQIITLS